MTIELLIRTLNRRRRLFLAAAALLAGLVLSAVHLAADVLVNVTPSVPVGFYLTAPIAVEPVPGDLVYFAPETVLGSTLSARGYVSPDAALLKPVAAAAGQHVCIHDGVLDIDGKPFSRLRPTDRLGRPLQPFHICRTLTRGELYVAVRDDRSLDSRYFGPVMIGAVLGKARPLWTF